MLSETESRVKELLPGYALGALTDDETRLVETHLAGCSACTQELRELQHVAEDLPLALVQTKPPPAVKQRLMETIHARAPRSIPIPEPSFWQRLTVFMRSTAPVLAIFLISILAILNFTQWKRLNQAANAPTPAMRVIALANTETFPGAIGTLVMDQHGTYGTLVVDSLQELDPLHQYQVWLIQDGQRTSAGLFSVNYEGYASLELHASQPLIAYDAIGITVEPAGGSPAPTGDKVLGGELSN